MEKGNLPFFIISFSFLLSNPSGNKGEGGGEMKVFRFPPRYFFPVFSDHVIYRSIGFV